MTSWCGQWGPLRFVLAALAAWLAVASLVLATIGPARVSPARAQDTPRQIAFTGEDGNIWLVGADGSGKTQVTTDGTVEIPYRDPNWSPDGSVLVFSRPAINDNERNGIFLLRDGQVERVPGISNCSSADFTTDGTRLVLLCALNRVPGASDITQDMLDADPSRAMVSMVDLDGANWTVLAPFPLELDGEATLWWQMLGTYDISVSPSDGEILVNSTLWSGDRTQRIHLFTADGERDGLIGVPGERGQVNGRFAGGGENILAMVCPGCYRDSAEDPNVTLTWLNRAGEPVETVYTLDPAETVIAYDLSPDETSIAISVAPGQTGANLVTGEIRVIEREAGTATVIGRGADLAWQPDGVPGPVATPDARPDPVATTGTATEAPVPTGEAMAFGERRIAYTGGDGNIWTMRDDGSDQVRLTSDGMVTDGIATYFGPSWSHDGTMLTFSGGHNLQSGQGVWLYRNGILSLIPNTAICGGAEFSPDNQRLLYSCAVDGAYDDEPPTDFATNPHRSLVSSSALDGSDQRVEIAYTTDGSGIDWGMGRSFISGAIADVDPGTGEMLVIISGYRWAGFALFTADGTMQGEIVETTDSVDTYGPATIRFMPNSDHVILTWCQVGCGRNSTGPTSDTIVVMERNGTLVTQWTPIMPGEVLAGLDISANGEFAVFARGTSHTGPFDLVVARADEEGTVIGNGSGPAWQPVAVDAAATTPETVAVPTIVAQPTGPVPTEGTMLYSAFDGTQWDIWKYDFGSGTLDRLTETPANETSPSMSPDGSRIVYLSDSSGSPQIWTMAINGMEQQQRAIWAGDPITEVVWAPGGDIFLLVVDGPDGPVVMTMPSAGGLIAELLPAPASDPTIDAQGALWYSTTIDGETVVVWSDGAVADLEATPGVAPTAREPIAGQNPAVSLDGILIVFETGEPGVRQIAGRWLTGWGTLALPRGPGDHHDPIVTSDAGYVLWIVDNGDTSSVWVAASGGQGNQYALVELGDHIAIDGLSWAP